MEYDLKNANPGDEFEVVVDWPHGSPLKKGEVVTFSGITHWDGLVKVASKDSKNWWVEQNHIKPLPPQIPEIEVGSVWVSDWAGFDGLEFTVIFADQKDVVYENKVGNRALEGRARFLWIFKPKPPEPVKFERFINLYDTNACRVHTNASSASISASENVNGFTVKLTWDGDGNIEVEKV